MIRIISALLLAFCTALVCADVLLIAEVRQSERMNLPVNGQSKKTVEAQFGTPDNQHAAVGNPPVSRWDYSQYSVYFEYDLVLFSVLHPGVVIEK